MDSSVSCTEKSGRKGISKKRKSDYLWAYIMILPTVLGIGIFYIGAFFQNLFYSFTDLGTFGKWSWVGLENYKKIFLDPEISVTLGNTFKYTFFAVPLTIGISIIVAVLLNSKIKGIGIYRTLYFLPAVTMPAAVAMVWKWLYNGKHGLVNMFLSKIGIDGPTWIVDPKFAMPALIIIAIWMGIGFNMIILLAGLQSIPRSFYEAASIDGAGHIKQFFMITLPLLSPTIFFVSIMALIGAFQMFDLVYLVIGKGNIVLENTKTIVYVFYKYAFEYQEKGYAAAIAVIIFLIIMIITIIQLKLQKKWVHYQ